MTFHLSDRVCAQCSVKFRDYPGRKYCIKCRTAECEVCRVTFNRTPKHGNNRFCSRKCKGKDDALRFTGNQYRKGKAPWNKNLKGIHLSPRSEFKPGMEPWNKGISVNLSPDTQFRPGNLPANTLYDGAITTRIDKQGKPRRWIRIAMAEWMPLARYVYQEAFGSIPEGYVIHHINHDTLDDRIENLEALNPPDHARAHRDGLIRARRQKAQR